MKYLPGLTTISLVLFAGLWFMLSQPDVHWLGIDETVVTRLATEAGRTPRSGFLNTDQGDLLLFFFLAAGTLGGFVMGYVCRALFPPTDKNAQRQSE
jgi:cobalt/nickel transport system permease protein